MDTRKRNAKRFLREKAGKINRGVSGVSDEHSKIIEHVQSCSDSAAALLAAACGTGIVVFAIALHGQAAAATDFSANMVEVAKQQAENIDIPVAGVCELPFAGKAFDVSVSANVLHVAKGPSTLLAEMQRVLKDGGNAAHRNGLFW